MLDFEFFLFLLSFSSLSLFVALCSANLRLSKSLATCGVFGEKLGFVKAPLLNDVVDFGLLKLDLNEPLLFENLLDCFSIITEFLL